MLWYLSNDSLLFQCFPLSTQMINSPPILESALVRIRISDLVHVLTQITVPSWKLHQQQNLKVAGLGTSRQQPLASLAV